MPTISNDLPTFTQALNEHKTLVCSKDGWGIRRGLKGFFTNKKKAMHKIGVAFNQFLDTQERLGVVTHTDAEKNQQVKEHYQSVIKAAKAVKKRLKAAPSKRNAQALTGLKRRMISLKYRVGANLGGIDAVENPKADAALKQKIEKEFLDWKQKQKIYLDKNLSTKEQEISLNLCRYPKFVEWMLTKGETKEELFKRIFRDGYSLPEFIEFYAVSRRMEECLLVGWIGRFGKNFFSMETVQNGETQHKVVKILMDGKKVNLLNEEEKVTFDGQLEKTVKSVLEVFKAKNDEPGDFTVFGETGIRRFKCQLHDKFNPTTGTYEPIDLSKPHSEWWKEYPIFERVSRDELLRRYPKMLTQKEGKVEYVETDKHLVGNMWMVIEKASTESDTLDLDASHGYMDIYIPQKNGEYLLLPFGKFADYFPTGFIGRLKFIVGTFGSKISYADENHCYFRRLQAAVPYGVDETMGQKLMEELRLSILMARAGNFVFQFPWENCSNWVYKSLKTAFGKRKKGGLVENHYKVYILSATPSSKILTGLIKIAKAHPKKLQPYAIKTILSFFGSFREKSIVVQGEKVGKKVGKSVANSGFKKKQEIYLPSKLPYLIKQGAPGFLSVGPI